MKKLLNFITSGLAGDDIEVTEENQDGLALYTIHAPKNVMGILIGKEGRTIRAVRSLARARAIKEGSSIAVKLEEKP